MKFHTKHLGLFPEKTDMFLYFLSKCIGFKLDEILKELFIILKGKNGRG